MAERTKVFISYSHDSPEHADRVLDLADALQHGGLEVILDQYVHPAPDEGWPRWMETRLDEANFVLMVCTETYRHRVLGQEQPGKGLGVRWEGNLIYNRIYNDKPSGSRFIPVLLEGGEPAQIPNPVQGHTYYLISHFDLSDAGYEGLYRHLTGQAPTPPPEIGAIRTLPPRSRRGPSGNPLISAAEDIARMSGQQESAGAIEVFFSYAHKDKRLRDQLETHLSNLKRQDIITGWHDRKIAAGTEWKGQIDSRLESARIILLLVSADFLASDYCYDIELKRALERHEAGEARVIPIILRPVDWHTAPFGKLQELPRDGKPVTSWKNRDEAFADVARGIREAVRSLAAGAAHSPTPAGPSPGGPPPPPERPWAVDPAPVPTWTPLSLSDLATLVVLPELASSETQQPALRINPARTAALVVGVQEYAELGNQLPGALEDALGFAHWLNKYHCVPRDQIFLVLSPRPDLLEWAGVFSAELNTFHDLFERDLKKWFVTHDIELFIVFWLGHGFINEEGDRKLICADADGMTLRNVDFHELRKVLGQDGFPTRQIFLVDACAVGVSRSPGAKITDVKFGRDRLSGMIRQFALFSTSPGEGSPALEKGNAESFSAILKSAIDCHKAPGPWPPDMPAIARVVQSKFDRRGTPHPRFLNVSWEGDVVDTCASSAELTPMDHKRLARLGNALETLTREVSVDVLVALARELPEELAFGLESGDAAATARRLAQNLLRAPMAVGGFLEALARIETISSLDRYKQDILDALGQLHFSQVPWTDVWDLVRILRGLDGRQAIDPHVFSEEARRFSEREPAAANITIKALRDPALAVGHFAQNLSREHPEPNPLLSFVAVLASRSAPEISERLDAWVARVAKDQGVAVPMPAQAGDEPGFLMMVADPYGLPAGSFKVDTWRFRGDRPGDNLDGTLRSRDELAELVDNQLGATAEPLWAELFLPVELLAEGLSGWDVEVAPGNTMAIDDRYPIRLRSWDRIGIGMHHKYFKPKRVRTDWQARWEKRPRAGSPADYHCVGLYKPDDYRAKDFVQRYWKEGPVCLAASLAAPEASGEIEKPMNILISLLVAGTPILVWPEAGSTGASPCDQVYQALKTFVQHDPLDQLPARVHDHRRKRLADVEHAPPEDWRLCLLWDDPERLPPNNDIPLVPPTRG